MLATFSPNLCESRTSWISSTAEWTRSSRLSSKLDAREISNSFDIDQGSSWADTVLSLLYRLDDITAEVAKIYEEKAMFLELKSWHQDKMYPVGHTADPEEEGMVDQETATVEHRKRKLDADVVALIAEADQSRLGITK